MQCQVAFYLRTETIIMMENAKVRKLSCGKRVMALVFTVDKTTYLNEVNLRLQGKCKLLLDKFPDGKAF